jgi:hypothetical protein
MGDKDVEDLKDNFFIKKEHNIKINVYRLGRSG